MKTMRKLLSLLLVAAMVLSFGVVAMAADGDYVITVNKATVGKDYAAYRIFGNVTSSGDNYAYTEPNADFQGVIDQYFEKITGTDGYKLKENVSDTDLAKAFAAAAAGKTAVVSEKAESETVELNVQTVGYYFVTSTVGASVMLTTVNKTANIEDKNLEPEPVDPPDPDNPSIKAVMVPDTTEGTADDAEMKASKNTMNIGEEADFVIAFTTKNYNANKLIEKYTITDDLAGGKFELVGKISVKIGNGEPVEYDSFPIELAWAENDKPLYELGTAVTVTYTAKLADTVEAGEKITNSAKVNAEDVELTGETETYTYGFDLVKVKEDMTVLNNAEFTVKDAAGTALKFTQTDKGYRYDENGTVTNIPVGTAFVYGLKNGTYTLTEVKTPDGYNPLADDVTVTIADKNNTATKDATDDTKYTTDTGAVVINRAGTELPSTGGIGTTIFYVIGGVLVLGAGVVLVSKKRMHTGE